MRYKSLFLISILIYFSSLNTFSQNIEGVTQFGNEKGIVCDFCFSKNGTMIIIPENNTINIYNTETQELLYKLSGGHNGQILSVDISPDSSMIISGGKDSLIILWDIKSQKIIQELCFHSGLITSVKFSPDQNKIASGSSDNTVVLYDLTTNNISYTFAEHRADVSSVAFNSNGNILASSSEDKTIIFRDTYTGEVVNDITTHKSFVRDIKFNNDDSRFISCDDNSRVYVWKTEDINNIIKLEEIKQGNKWILGVDILKSSSTFVSGGIDGKIKIKTNFNERTLNLNKIIHKVRFKPENSSIIKIAVATRGRGVLLIDTSKIKNEKI